MNNQTGVPIKAGYVYHIDDAYFKTANDGFLMKNKENGHSRPTYYCFKDDTTSLLWCVPLSTQVEKYQKYIDKSIQKRGECLGIFIGEYDNKLNAFLIQNMFPVTEKYLDHIHTRNGQPLPVSHKVQKEVESRLKRVLLLSRKGKKVVFPDIMRLEQMMLNELSQQKQTTNLSPIVANSQNSKRILMQLDNNQLHALNNSGIPFKREKTKPGVTAIIISVDSKDAPKVKAFIANVTNTKQKS